MIRLHGLVLMNFGRISGLEWMIYTVRTSTFAKEDRKNIAKYLAQYSVSAPRRFRQELKRYIKIVSHTPYIFSKYNADTNYRHVVIFGSYVMFYIASEEDKIVYIYRVLHGSQDIENIL